MAEKQAKADFIATLAELKGGRVVAEIGDKFSGLIAAVAETGAAGEITLKLKVKPKTIRQLEVKEVEVDYAIAVKPPSQSQGATLFFVTRDRRLSRRNEDQLEITFEERQEIQK